MDITPIIASSFIVKSSSRKDDILAAIKNPINTELVEQLVSYLDDEYTQPIDHVTPHTVPEVETEPADSGSISPSPRPAPSGGGGEPSLASLFGDDVEEPLDDSEENSEMPEEAPDISEPEPIAPEPEIPSSTAVSVIDTIQASLNANTATEGVRASKQIGDEIWIYYHDAINLNKIMESVIDAVPDTLEFNRLARSNNAIVFTTR